MLTFFQNVILMIAENVLHIYLYVQFNYSNMTNVLYAIRMKYLLTLQPVKIIL